MTSLWQAAKKVAALAASFVEAQARVAVMICSHLTPEARSVRIVEISDELTQLDYAPLGIRTSHCRSHLAAELTAINAASIAA